MSRMPRRTLAALTLLSAATLLSTTACSSDGDTGTNTRSVRSAEPSPAKATPAADTDEVSAADELAEGAPDLMGDRMVLRQDRTRDSASLEFGKAKKGDGEALGITVSCEGKGRIEVVLRPMDASFPVNCREGQVTSVHNVFGLDGADRAGTVSVTAAPGVRWSLSVGRGEPPKQDLSD
ncbi:hypothetical protein JIX56_26660 [Streptomyces sp. CA-210063]|uniref:hypothetical protein n=1 Tax=Streptomyces sp. CA-210063 TaxID=2801029 RepID=UPI00214B895F|nr:hypothetical protein [Streptomyces sp. CA-210063]UUU33163.1 hypothetical protein JIX56_26660 [Streptomyces sp. CA-210063]